MRSPVVNFPAHERRRHEEAERPREDAAWKETLRRALPGDQADTFVAEFEALPLPFSGQRFIEEITAGGDSEAVLRRAMMVHNYVRQHGWPSNYGIVEASTTTKPAATEAEAAKAGPRPPTAEEQGAARIRIRYEKRLSEIGQLASAVPSLQPVAPASGGARGAEGLGRADPRLGGAALARGQPRRVVGAGDRDGPGAGVTGAAAILIA